MRFSSLSVRSIFRFIFILHSNWDEFFNVSFTFFYFFYFFYFFFPYIVSHQGLYILELPLNIFKVDTYRGTSTGTRQGKDPQTNYRIDKSTLN
jgi:hypothetical protein